ncbi:hypothetical protein HOY80DRAFT_940912 [Tuber brumale]|nr:hypothetical protein HOY80DRAFT_940912 [Tuber brumale]
MEHHSNTDYLGSGWQKACASCPVTAAVTLFYSYFSFMSGLCVQCASRKDSPRVPSGFIVVYPLCVCHANLITVSRTLSPTMHRKCAHAKKLAVRVARESKLKNLKVRRKLGLNTFFFVCCLIGIERVCACGPVCLQELCLEKTRRLAIRNQMGLTLSVN